LETEIEQVWFLPRCADSCLDRNVVADLVSPRRRFPKSSSALWLNSQPFGQPRLPVPLQSIKVGANRMEGEISRNRLNRLTGHFYTNVNLLMLQPVGRKTILLENIDIGCVAFRFTP
jgi:hypothetical protein